MMLISQFFFFFLIRLLFVLYFRIIVDVIKDTSNKLYFIIDKYRLMYNLKMKMIFSFYTSYLFHIYIYIMLIKIKK